jgi:hypothetical protein
MAARVDRWKSPANHDARPQHSERPLPILKAANCPGWRQEAQQQRVDCFPESLYLIKWFILSKRLGVGELFDWHPRHCLADRTGRFLSATARR